MKHFYQKSKSMKTKNLLLLGLIALCSVFGVKAQTVSSSGDYAGNVTLSITGASGVTQIDWYNGGSDVATITPDSVGHVSTSFIPATAGTYKAIITTATGFDTTNAVVVSAMPVPLVAVNGAAPGTGYVGTCFSSNSFSFSVGNLSHSFSYSWDFGDSSAISTAYSPSHSYSKVGNYKVTVTVVDGAASSTYDQYVTVYPNPGASFNVVPGTVNGNAYTFVSSSSVSSGYIASYSWTFGDGSGDTLSNPSKIYAAIGSYHVGLTITTDMGCTASTTSVLNVVLTGSNAFTVNHSTSCFNNNSFTFTNALGNSNGASYRWNFGDSTFSNSYSPSHSYSAPGSYIVILQVTIDTTVSYFSKTVTVYPKPSVSYSVTAGTGNGHSYTFNNTSSIANGSVSYAWNFGDGTVDSTTSPTHTFAAIGVYHVKLKATSDNGCKDSVTATQNITLTSIAASAAFTANHAAACLNGNSFSFANHLGNSNGASYAWAYGDSTFSSGYNGSHVYTAAGTYTVSVTATIDTTVATYSQTVTVYPKPSVSYSVIAGTGNGHSYTFNNTSTIASGTASYAWNFGDGTVDSTTSPIHTFAAVGVYHVKLKATSDNDCKDSVTATQNITLTSIAASAAFTANHAAACLNGNSFSFANHLGNANGATYTWAYGDSTFYTGYNGSHTYTAAGTYTVSVTATIDTTVATYSQTVTVYPKPTVSYNTIAGTGNGSSYTFNNTSSIASGSVSYAWNFGDGTVDSTTTPTHTYTAVGSYAVKLKATSDNGCSDSLTKTQNITLTGIPASAAFTANHAGACLNGNSFSFANNLGNSNGATYAWAYGDSTFSAGYNGSHSYSAAGTYTVTVTATIDTTVATYSQTVTVYPKPSVSYSVIAGTGNGSSYTFTSNASIASGSFNNAWAFGDGTVDSTNSPAHTFAAVGTYPVKLVVTSDKGCKDSVTVSQNITLTSIAASAAFTANHAAECLNGNSFSFANHLGNSNGATYAWAYGDSTFSAGYNGSHTYTAAGTYTVTVTATIDTTVAQYAQTVTVYPKPSASYSVLAGTVNGSAYTFNSTSTIASGSMNYAWNFGDGTVDSIANPSKIFTTTGSYPVKLVVTSDNGCKDSVTVSQNVVLSGTAAFTVNTAGQCLNGNSFSFFNGLSNGSSITYNWAYGDSTFSTGYNGSHTYTAAGTYNVTLTVTIDTSVAHFSKLVTVYPKPSVSYNVVAGTGNGNSYSFISTSTIASGSMNYAWNFGDGTVDSTSNPTHTFTAVGIYSVKLVLTSDNGCKDSLTKTQNITLTGIASSAAFTANHAAECLNGNSFSFANNLGNSNGATYAWAYGDSTFSSGYNGSHTYTAAGTYIVTLTATIDTTVAYYSQTVTVYPKPSVAYSVTAGTGNGNSYTFVSNSSIALGSMNYAWTFGDGTVDSTVNPTHTFAAVGTYPVKLIVTSDNGCKDSVTVSQNITLTGIAASAAFTANHAAECLNGNSFSFANNLGNSNGATYAWAYGDSTFGAGYNGSHSYTAAGTYTVTLTATIDTTVAHYSQTVTVYSKPSVSYSVTAGTGNGNSYTFVSNSSIASGSMNYAWTFGDGTVDSTVNPTHTFAAVGTYPVKLVVTSDNGCKDSVTVSQNITLTGIAASAAFTANHAAECLNGNSFSFANNLGNSNGATYAWAYGDSTFGAGYNGSHSYTAAGTYTVTLTATIDTTVAHYSQTVTVYPKPSVSYSVTAGTGNGNSYTFVSNSTIASGAMNYAWTFGDGTVDSTVNPTHTFAAVGTYPVKLIVTSDNGCKDSVTVSQNITLTGIAATAAFTANHAAECLNGNSFSFANNLGNSNGATYTWAYGDSTFYTGYNGSHTYTAAGTYTVTLTATIDTTVATYSQTVTVYPKPSVSYSVIPGTSNGSAYTFISNATIASGYMNFAWNFGDGSVDSTVNPAHIFAAVGTYPVKLVVTSDNGCKDSVTVSQNITLTGIAATAAFTANHAAECLNGNSFSFANNLGNSNGATYAWAYGDSTFGAGYNGSHSYTAAGTYTVTLTVTIDTSIATYSQTVTVYPKPTVSYSVTPGTGNGSAYTFYSSASIVSGSMNYAWTFGDGTVDSSASPTHTFAAVGTYPVKLKVYSNHGCSDSVTVSQNITLTGVIPSAAFTANHAAECLNGNSFSFANNLGNSNGATYTWAYGDSTFSAGYNGSHTYTAAGTFTVTLTATIDTSIATYSQVVTVYPKPAVAFSMYAGTGNGTSYTYISSSAISSGWIATYAWDFGNGTTDSVSNPNTAYASVGSFPVKLVVTSDHGCKDSVTVVENITITSTAPSAVFTVNHSGQCQSGNSFTFTNHLSNTAGIGYSWYFGDSTAVSNTFSSAHSYANPGTYTVTLTVTIDTTVSTYSQTVTVYPQPAASYYLLLNTVGTPLNPDLHICFSPGLDFSWIENSTILSGNMTYSWTYGTNNYFDRNGHATTSTNPRIVFNAAGTYPVKLVVTSDHGCQDSMQHVIYLSQPHAIFSTTVTYPSNDTTINPAIDFAGNTSYDPGGTLVDYAWVYENGTHVHSAADSFLGPLHFARGGVYTNQLTVTSDAGCTNSVSHGLTFYIKPVGQFTLGNLVYPTKWSAPTDTVATNTSSVDETPQTLTYSWNFGDGSSAISGTKPYHTYTTGAASRTVTLTVTNTNGGYTNTYTQTLNNVYIRPQAAFGYSRTSGNTATLKVAFTNHTTSNDLGSPAGSLTYAWDFGDYTTSTAQNPGTHTYASGGTYTVQLIVTNPVGGLKDTISQQFTYYVKPVAAFTYTKTSSATAQLSFDFDGSTSSINDATAGLTYAWSFDDGGSSTGITTSHSFTSGGLHTATLIVTSSNGNVASSSVSQSFTYYVTPVASFTDTRTSAPTASLSVAFDASASSINDATATLSYAWTFGDGGSATGKTPSHNYASGGAHTVTLTVTSNHGSVTDVSSRSVTYYVTPVAAFTYSLTSAPTAKVSVDFNASTSSINDATATLSYDWDFNDGSSHGSGATVSHSYDSAVAHTVTLTVTSNHGSVSDFATHTFTYNVKPVPAFASNVNYGGDIYSNPSVEFDATTTVSHDLAANLNYAWDFGDGNTGTGTTPSNTYSTGGSKTVKLIVTNTNGGLVDSVSHTVNVVITPKAVINVTSYASTTSSDSTYVDFWADNTVAPAVNSSIVTGSIAGYSWTFDLYQISTGITYSNWASSSNYESAIELLNTELTDWQITAKLVATSDLSVTDNATAVYLSGTAGSGYNPFKNNTVNHPAVVFATPTKYVGMSLYPNPVVNETAISFKAVSETTTIVVYDQSGKLLKQLSIPTQTNQITKYTFSVAGLVKGVYNVLVVDHSGKRIGTTKFVKAN